jgi:transcription elongation factor SPT5
VDYGGGDRGRGSKRLRSSILIDDMAQVDDESDIDDVVSGGDNGESLIELPY